MGLREGFIGERYIYLPMDIIANLSENEFTNDLYPTHIGFFPNAKMHFCERPSGSNQYILIYCTNGKGWYKINGKSFLITSGDFFIISPNIPHSYGADEESPWTIYWVHFAGNKAKYYGDNLIYPSKLITSEKSRILERISVFEDALNNLLIGYDFDNLMFVSSCMHYFLGSLRFIKNYKLSSRHELNSNRIISHAIHFMQENIESKISIADISKYLKLSPAYFCAYFTKETSTSPISFFNNMKIQYACKLLGTTSMTIKEISFKIGINDPYYFTRLFRKTMGVPPTRYREGTIE